MARPPRVQLARTIAIIASRLLRPGKGVSGGLVSGTTARQIDPSEPPPDPAPAGTPMVFRRYWATLPYGSSITASTFTVGLVGSGADIEVVQQSGPSGGDVWDSALYAGGGMDFDLVIGTNSIQVDPDDSGTPEGLTFAPVIVDEDITMLEVTLATPLSGSNSSGTNISRVRLKTTMPA